MPAKRSKRKRLPLHGGQNKPAKRTPAPAGKPKAKKAAKKASKKRKSAPRKPAPKAPKPAKGKRKAAKAPKRPPKAPKRPPKAPSKQAPKAPKRPPKAPKRSPKTAKSSARSEAAKRGWLKRHKRQRLLDAMADLEMRKRDQDATDDPDAQPIGWTLRREHVREIDGQRWQRIAVDFSDDVYEARRLAILEELEIDLLNKGQLYDYLTWFGDHYDIEIGDMYQMYLGYSPGAGEGEG